MLEDEGIVFEEDGGISKIRQEFFVTDVAGPNCSKNSGSKRKRTYDDSSGKYELHKKSSNISWTHVTEEYLKQEILNTLQKRNVGKTC